MLLFYCLINIILLIKCRSVSQSFYNIFDLFLFTQNIFISNSGIKFEHVISSKI